MRYFIFILLFIVVNFANGSQKKIIIGSFDTKPQAVKALLKLDTTITTRLKDTLKSGSIHLKARKSGKLFIVVVEPIENNSKAKEIKSQLPKPYNKVGFISNYSAPTNSQNEEVQLDLAKKEDKPSQNIPALSSIYDNNKSKEKIEEEKAPKEEVVVPQKEENQKEVVEEEKIEKVEEDIKDIEPISSIDEVEKINKKNKPDKIKKEENASSESMHTQESSFGFTNIAEYIRSGSISLFNGFINIVLNSIIYIAILLLLLSAFIYISALKKTVVLENEIKSLKKDKEEKAVLAQNLTLDINRLKTYYNDLIESFRKPIEILRENFNKPHINAEDVSAARASKTLEQLLVAHEELGGEITIEKTEFDLNVLVRNVTKKKRNSCKDSVKIVTDFDLPALSKIVGDSSKVARIFSILTGFSCRHTNVGRILVALNEASQDVDGNITIVVIVKSNKNGFSKEAIDKINQSFAISNATHDSTNVDKDIEELIIAKRLIESMNGNIAFKGKEGFENFFIFNMELKVINRQTMQDNFLSRKFILKSSVLLLSKDDDSTEYLANDLETLNIVPKICKNWEDMENRLKDVFLFIDIVIIQNSSLDSIDAKKLIQKARDKNFALLIISEDSERENNIIQKTIKEDKNSANEAPIILKTLKKPYGKEEFFKLLNTIHNEQKPTTLTSNTKKSA